MGKQIYDIVPPSAPQQTKRTSRVRFVARTHDFIPRPVQRELSRWVRIARVLFTTSKYAGVFSSVALVVVSAGLVWAWAAMFGGEHAEVFPTRVEVSANTPDGDNWFNSGQALTRELSADAVSDDFNASNSAASTVAEEDDVSAPEDASIFERVRMFLGLGTARAQDAMEQPAPTESTSEPVEETPAEELETGEPPAAEQEGDSAGAADSAEGVEENAPLDEPEILIPDVDGELPPAEEVSPEPENPVTIYTRYKSVELSGFSLPNAQQVDAIRQVQIKLSFASRGVADEDDHIALEWSTDGAQWNVAHIFQQNTFYSNNLNGNYFAFDITEELAALAGGSISAYDISALRLRVTAFTNNEIFTPAYVDSAWLDVAYDEKTPELTYDEKPKVRLAAGPYATLSGKDFRADEDPAFAFTNPQLTLVDLQNMADAGDVEVLADKKGKLRGRAEEQIAQEESAGSEADAVSEQENSGGDVPQDTGAADSLKASPTEPILKLVDEILGRLFGKKNMDGIEQAPPEESQESAVEQSTDEDTDATEAPTREEDSGPKQSVGEEQAKDGEPIIEEGEEVVSEESPNTPAEDVPEETPTVPVDETPSETPDILEQIIDIILPKDAQAQANAGESISARVLDPLGVQPNILANVTRSFGTGGERFEVSLKKPLNSFRPGRYTLEVEIETSDSVVVLRQDFSWGVLAVNVDKSIYTPQDTQAYIQMGVLDDGGYTICDADVQVAVTAPNGAQTLFTTADGTVQYSGECKGNSVVQVPDYFAYYELPQEVGVYTVEVQATHKNGTHTIADAFEVRPSVPLDVARRGPTRIYPLEPYPVTLSVVANEDFTGVVRERVPASFEISSPQNSTPYSDIRIEGEEQVITWNVGLKQGDSVEFGYWFDAPDVSPEFYLLGPAEFIPSQQNTKNFTEIRQWQIASDTALTALQAAANWEADDTAYVDFANPQLGGSPQTLSRALDDVDADFGNMNSLNWKVTYFLSGTADNDTYELQVRIVNGGTILAAANAGGTAQQVSANVTSTTDVTTGPTAFAYVNTSANKATWNGASVELIQVHGKVQGWDGNYIRTDFTEFTGDYTIASGIQIDGVLRQTDESTAFNCSAVGSVTVELRVNGAGSDSTACNTSGGTYQFTGISANNNDVITVWANDGGSNYSGSIVYISDGAAEANLDLYQNRVIARHDATGPVTNTSFNQCEDTSPAACNDADIGFDTSSGLTVANGLELHIWDTDTFTPGGAVETSPSTSASSADGDVHIDGTGELNVGINALSVGGDLDNEGTLSGTEPQTTTFTAIAPDHSITTNGDSFDNVVFNGSGGGWEFVGATLIDNLTMTAGTLSETGSDTIAVFEDVTGTAGVITFTGTSTLEQSVSATETFGPSTANTDWTFYNLTFSRSAGTAVIDTNSCSDCDITVTNQLAVSTSGDGAGVELQAGDKTWSLTSANQSDPFDNDGQGADAGTLTAETSTFDYAGDYDSGDVVVENATYNNLTLTSDGVAENYDAAAAVTVTGDLLINANATLIGTDNWTVNGSVAGAGTITLTGGTFKQEVGGTETFGTTSGTANWTFNNLTFARSGGTAVIDVDDHASPGTITVSGVLALSESGDGAGTTLQAGNRTWNLTNPDSADPFDNDGQGADAGVLTAESSTFDYAGDSNSVDVVVENVTYFNLTLTSDGVAENYDAAAAVTVTGDLLINANATLIGTDNWIVNGSATGAGLVNLTSGTFTLDVAAAESIGATDAGEWIFSSLTMSNSQGASNPEIIDPVSGGTGQITVNGTFTIGPSADASTTTFDNETADDRVLDINGSILIDSQGIFLASSSVEFRIATNFTNNGVFTANSGTVTFDGATTTVLAGSGSPAITFNNFTSITASKTINFTASETFQIDGVFTINGQASGTQINLHSTSQSTKWNINHQGTESIQFAHVEDGGCDGSTTNISLDSTSTDSVSGSGNDSCWLFPALSFILDATSKSIALTSGNTFTNTATTTLTVTSRSEFGFNLTAYETGLLTHTATSATIADWGSPYETPAAWTGTCIGASECGWGYNTDEADFAWGATYYAAFAPLADAPGDIVAKSTGPVTSDVTTITYRASVSAIQEAGPYETTIRYIVTPKF